MLECDRDLSQSLADDVFIDEAERENHATPTPSPTLDPALPEQRVGSFGPAHRFDDERRGVVDRQLW